MYLLLSDRIDELTYIIMSLSFRLQQMQESGGCPYIHFRLYEDCQRMTSSYVQMVSDIKRHVSHLAAAENQGVVPIISAGQIFPGPAAGEAYCKYKTLVLPSVPNHNMHFVVVLHTPPNWAGGTREPVRLLFASQNLYLLGFLHGNIWQTLQDADLGTDITEAEKLQWTRPLPFKGNYRGLAGDPSSLDMWFHGQSDTYWSLSAFSSPKATKRSMLRTVVSISEAVRFRELLTRIVMGFAAGLYGPTLQPWVMLWPSLVPNTPTPRIFTTAFDDDHFKNWDVYCKLARAGAQGFAPGTRGFATYESLIAFLGACLH